MKKILQTAAAGFTLVEMLIAMGLMTIFLVVLSDIVVSISQVSQESDATSSVAEDGRYILSRLSYDIERATSVTTPAALGNTTNNLVMVIGGATYTYSLSSGNLQLAVSPNTDNLNGGDTTISNFTVQRLGNSGGKETLTVNFTATSKTIRNGSTLESKTYTTTVGRR